MTYNPARQSDVRYPETNVVALFDAESHQQGVKDVERINQFSFYDLGKVLSRLSLIQGEVAPATIIMDLWSAQIRLKNLLDGKPIALGVSRTVAEQLRKDVGRVVDLCTESVNESGERHSNFRMEPSRCWSHGGCILSMIWRLNLKPCFKRR